MTEAELTVMLRDRYAPPEWALMPQVRNGTGFTRRTTRTADALALGLYPSRGIHLHGFEIKVSRSDLRRELSLPDKAESICRFCDFWWIVAPDEVVSGFELPPTWGVLIPRDGKLVAKTKAPKLDSRRMDTPFVAAVFRAAQGVVTGENEIATARRLGHEEGYREGKEYAERMFARERENHIEFQQIVQRFETESGVGVSRRWESGNIGRAVRFIKNGGIDSSRQQLADLADRATRIAAEIREVLDAGGAA